MKTKFEIEVTVNNNPKSSVAHCYNMGYDCGMNGANTTNCNFGLFSSAENTAAWEAGKAQAEQDKKKK
jgi:hypothetical protein